MRKLAAAIAAIFICGAGAMAQSPAGSQNSRVGGLFFANQYSQWVGRVYTGNSAAGAGSITLYYGSATLPDGRVIIPFSTSIPLTINPGGSNSETVTPTAVSGCGSNPQMGTCTVTATFANVHGGGEFVVSGSGGLDEAIADAGAASGGLVVVSAGFGGSTSTITGATPIGSVNIMDVRTGGPVYYSKSGAGYAQAHLITAAANNDAAGTVTLASGTATLTFKQAWTSAPVCVANSQGTTNAVKVAVTTTTATFTSSSGADASTVSYVCYGNPN